MISKTMTSLAIIKVNSDRGMDYIESFVPFLVHIIKNKNYKEIDVHKFIEEFEHIYGLIVPYHAMITIINRAKRRGYIEQHHKKYFPVTKKIVEDDFTDITVMQITKYNKVINSFIDFASKNFKKELSFKEAEDALLDFIKDHDVEILFATQSGSMIPNVRSKKANIFMLGNFIANALSKEPDIFEYIVDISLGQAFADAIIYEEFRNYVCKLKGMECYLDTGIIFRLLGTSGLAKKKAYQELLNTLIESKAKLFIFTHTYDEIMTILYNCISWFDNPEFDANKASMSMLYFISNSFTKSDVELYIAQVMSTLERFKITVVDVPSFTENIKYQIDEEELRDIIFDIYKTHDPKFEYYDKEDTINKDIDSISAIYRLRKGRIFRNLKDATHLFVTSNWAIATSTKEYEKTKIDKQTIPSAVTDTFLGTILWVSNPKKYREVNRVRLLADVYASIQPDDKLFRQYLSQLSSLCENKAISHEEYYVLRSTSVAINMLKEKTYNDPDNYTISTPNEILNEMKEKIRENIGKEVETKYLLEKESRRKAEIELEELGTTYSLTENKLHDLSYGVKWFSDKISGILSFIIIAVIAPAIIIGAFWPVINDLIRSHISSNIYVFWMVIFAFFSVFSVLNLLSGFSLKKLRIPIRKYINKWLSEKIENRKRPSDNQ